ncbi:uncharacterized protein BO87DRAFT_399844 [Aspergillus neoniger CBS 115656]|uniref:Uncharacterized protein n=1 Tax=Aspergillus neoniger (strain CBS 115656) TaxID=1448310 RepID=A0A318YB12_ASPNB|nr:hypothetical protein BO87DRAFT_399844 [Aspergillus neoniger CBS 115656]PYH31154.1 hypothetical protein BO87DRAFT_399844 [Aspergillus neoniger CBS 115656]
MPTEYTEIALAVGYIHLLPFFLGVKIQAVDSNAARKPKTSTGEADIAGPRSTYLPSWAMKRSQTEVSKPLNVVSLTPPVDIELMIGVKPRHFFTSTDKVACRSSIKLVISGISYRP